MARTELEITKINLFGKLPEQNLDELIKENERLLGTLDSNGSLPLKEKGVAV